MPSTVVIRNSRKEGGSTVKNAPTFSGGDVYLDMIHADSNVAIANVTFTPCARSYWHTHEKGQVLRVTMGSGWVCDKGGKPQPINIGDLIYAPPGTTHWHGAGKGCAMTHLVIGLGETKWLDAVSDEEYKKIEA
ncbi:uncharacterized protein PAC_06092 [Phialocephala subalpina]|uniref:Cupin type-2 domain-containing protein n=1 Tax=Phialocephala subalpina TaxID=576137 RepID=A0A1L7WTU8_9HELO|nr:uncharacterized protein PAC_06092 [Phialocephala subalpina]